MPAFSTRKARVRRKAGMALVCASVLALAGCSENAADPSAQIGPNPGLPEPQQALFPAMKIARVVGWAEGEKPSVPQGMQVQALATGLEHPRSLYVLPNGDILVVESRAPKGKPIMRPKELVMGWVQSFATGGGGGGESNRITLLRDADGDGTPEVRSVFLDNLHSPFGVALVGSDLYVANADAIVRYPYNTGDTEITAPGTVLTQLPGGPINHHWTKSLVASPDGSLLYVGIGSNSNAGERGMEAEKNRAAILEVDRASGRWRVFADGLRNPNGLSFEPQTGALWTVVNERDELGPDLVPDYLTSVKEGGFYGWPYSYWGQHIDPRVQPQRPDLVAKAIVPDYSLSSHVAPLGLAFYTGTNLPEAYRGGAFIGEHGSWNRLQFTGYKVVFVPFANGRPNGPAQDVVTGFLNADNQARGRPVGLAVDRTGALLVADDVGNAVWRVTSAGQ
nr:sorbosone dehydrogenase family protein [Phyllobacterium salinisoli]